MTCDDYEALIDDMRQDKKNSSPDEINFTLLSDIGQPQINMTATPGQIGAALDIYRDRCTLRKVAGYFAKVC